MSPIKDPAAYPDDWAEIRAKILARSAATDDFWQDGRARCECREECGGPHLHEDGGRCLEQHGEKALGFKGDVVLTVAHLDHDAAGGDHSEDNLRALCQRCHLKLDAESNRIKASATRAHNRAVGTAPLFGVGA